MQQTAATTGNAARTSEAEAQLRHILEERLDTARADLQVSWSCMRLCKAANRSGPRVRMSHTLHALNMHLLVLIVHCCMMLYRQGALQLLHSKQRCNSSGPESERLAHASGLRWLVSTGLKTALMLPATDTR